MMLIQSGSVFADRVRARHRLESQRRDDGSIPLRSIVAAPPRARRSRASSPSSPRAHFAFAGGVDVADDRRSHPFDPALLGERTIVARPRLAPLGPFAHAGGDFAAAGRRARQRSRGRARLSSAATTTTHCGRSAPIRRFRAIHEAFLPEAPRRRPGDVDVDSAVAAAKLNDAETIEDACAWLRPRERIAVLNDRALIAMLARLRNARGRAGNSNAGQL